MDPIDFVLALVVLAGLLENRFVVIPLAAILLVFLRGVAARLQKSMGFRRIEWAIVICLAFWLANYLWSTGDLRNLVSEEFLRHDGALLVVYPTFVFLLGWPLKPRQLRRFWMVFVGVLGLVAVPGVILSLRLPHPFIVEQLKVVGFDKLIGEEIFLGWYEAHNTTGGVYALAAVMALTLMQEEKLKIRTRILLWLLLASCLGGLAFTFSRGSYLAFVAGAAVVVPLKRMGRAIKAGLLVALPLVLIFAMTSATVSRIDTITDPYNVTNADRLRLWEEALEDFSMSPLVGIGFGRYNDVAAQFSGVKHLVYVETRGEIRNDDGHAHNSYLHFMAEGGVVGLLLTLWVWWCAWTELSFFERTRSGSRTYWLCREGKGCMVAVLVMSLTEHMLGRGSVVLVVMALVGMTLASARVEAEAPRQLVPVSGAKAVVAGTG